METDVTRGQASWAKMMSPVGKLTTVTQKNVFEHASYNAELPKTFFENASLFQHLKNCFENAALL
jgi:hypothetical protein